MVGQQTLNLLIEVRILAPQPPSHPATVSDSSPLAFSQLFSRIRNSLIRRERSVRCRPRALAAFD